jgi:hypothetical protein
MDAFPLANLELGDVLELPGTAPRTVRGRVSLPVVVGSMSGFLIMGEFDMLLSLPSDVRERLTTYEDPLDYLPKELEGAPVASEGALNYWSPHVPALSGAMGEVLYRVVSVRGSVDPVVIIYRGRELIVFSATGRAEAGSTGVHRMTRGVDNNVAVERHSALVRPVVLPMPVPVPAVEREHVTVR